MTQQNNLRTNHYIRIVTLTTGDRVLCLFGEVRDDTEEKKVIGYRMVFPYTLSLGDPNDDGTIPIRYSRWCPYSPIQEHRLSGDHIISVVYPDEGILDNYVEQLKEFDVTPDQIFQEVVDNGNNGEPAEAGE